MKIKQIIFNIFLVLGILLISEVAVSNQSTRAHYLSQLGVSSQSIQSIQNLETKLLKDFKVSSAADMKSKRAQARRDQNNQSESRQTKLKLKRVASVYNKTLKKYLKPNQIAGYMSYLNASRELIHIPGGFYSPYVLGSFIRL